MDEFEVNDTKQVYRKSYKFWKHLSCFKCCCKKSIREKYNQQLMVMGLQKLKNEMNVVTLLNNVRKLEAGLAAVIKNDKALIDDAKMLYFKKCSLYVPSSP